MGKFFQVIIMLFSLTCNMINAKWWYLGLQGDSAVSKLLSSPVSQQLSLVFRPDMQTKNSENLYDINQAKSKRELAVRRYCWNLKSNVLTAPLQQQFCLKNFKLVEVAGRGARRAIDECQHQFKFKRWNCTVYDRPHVFGRITRTKSRETAFIHAINSAALMYEVTLACKRGDLTKCVCHNKKSYQNNRPPADSFSGVASSSSETNHKWTGCSDNVLFGYKISKKFVDSEEKQQLGQRIATKTKTKQLMNIHNNEVGRRIIFKNMKQMCKCHGVSGSCSIKVCWKVMPDFRVIGDELMKSYSAATRIKSKQPQVRIQKLREIVLSRYSRNAANSVMHKDVLVFIDRSPNFCRKHNADGSLGLSNRMCFQSKQAASRFGYPSDWHEVKQKCGSLCCGGGFRKRVMTIVEDCECEFQWCCTVKCKKCEKKVVQYFCQ